MTCPLREWRVVARLGFGRRSCSGTETGCQRRGTVGIAWQRSGRTAHPGPTEILPKLGRCACFACTTENLNGFVIQILNALPNRGRQFIPRCASRQCDQFWRGIVRAGRGLFGLFDRRDGVGDRRRRGVIGSMLEPSAPGSCTRLSISLGVPEWRLLNKQPQPILTNDRNPN